MFRGLEHTGIASPDPERLADWYVSRLGFTINHRYNGNVFVRAPNGTMLEIIPSEGERGPQGMKDPGLRHLAIDVDDFDAALARLRELGVHFYTEPANLKGNLIVFFADADGNYLHLIRREKPLP
jgi:glyoxylase I family protein